MAAKINKVVFGSDVLIDLSGDTITAADVINSKTFHGLDGETYEGTCTYDSDTSGDTIQVAEMLATKTAHARGALLTGTMPNNGSAGGTISTKAGSYTIAQGYHDGSGKVTLDGVSQLIPGNLRSGVTILGVTGDMDEDTENPETGKTVTPSKVSQTITPASGYTCFREVTVNPISYSTSANAAGGLTAVIGG